MSEKVVSYYKDVKSGSSTGVSFTVDLPLGCRSLWQLYTGYDAVLNSALGDIANASYITSLIINGYTVI